MNIYVGIDIAKHNHFAAAISFNTEIIIEPFNFSSQQKNPGNLAVPGHLTFGHTVSYDTKFILLSVVSDYSITVATRPDPTVRPPSRYQTGVLRCSNGDFSCDLCGKSAFSTVSVWFFGILLSWCYHDNLFLILSP